jgi:competence protein ComFB
MKLKERYNLDNLGNRSQEMVFDAIDKLMEGGSDMCTCDECISDLAAWTLNHVTPRYYTSLLAPLNPDPGKERQMRVQIELALAAGLKKLKEHPHHA